MIEELNWDWLPNSVRIKTIADGSCLFHSILLAFCKPYKLADQNERRNMVKIFRNKLADKLVDYYKIISRGKLEELSRDMPEVKLENMVALLRSNKPVDNRFNELISIETNLNIFLLNYNTKDVILTGDENILYKSARKSVVILYLPSAEHYDLVGEINAGIIRTLFDSNDMFIKRILNKLSSKLRRNG